MARTDANPPLPEFRNDYVLYEVDAQWLSDFNDRLKDYRAYGVREQEESP